MGHLAPPGKSSRRGALQPRGVGTQGRVCAQGRRRRDMCARNGRRCMNLVHRRGIVPDPVDVQLRDIKRQGSTMAAVAHICGTLMLVLFSLGSAVGICATLVDSLTRTGLSWASVPDAIALTVSFMLVLCMDVASLSAAFQIRQLATRRVAALPY